MDDSRFPPSELQRIDQLIDACECCVHHASLDALGQALRDCTLITGGVLPRATQARLETLYNSIADSKLAGIGIVRGYITLSIYARRELRRDESIAYGLKALLWANKTHDPVLRARAHKVLGAAQGEAGNFLTAINHLLNGLAEVSHFDTPVEVEVLVTLGAMLTFIGQYRRALTVLQRARERADIVRAPSVPRAGLYCNLAVVYHVLGDYRRGLSAVSIASDLLDAARREGGLECPHYVNYIQVCLLLETGQLAEAARCLATARRATHYEAFSTPMLRLAEGLVSIHEGKTESGLQAVDEAVAEEARTRPYAGLVERLLVAARAYELAGKPDEARARIKQAIDHALKLRRPGDPGQAEDDGTLALLAQRSEQLGHIDVAAVRRRKLQNMAALAELPEYPCARHVFRVGRLSYLLARQIGLPEGEAQRLSLAGTLHDIGKIAVPRELLARHEPLSAIEMEAVRTHAVGGGNLLREFEGPEYRTAIEAARSHHERWDGTGYPDGLRGEAIPLAARIVAVAEAYDAMTHERPWRKALPVGETLNEIRNQAGRQFDARLVESFVACVERLHREQPNVDAYLSEEAQTSELVALQTRIDTALRECREASPALA